MGYAADVRKADGVVVGTWQGGDVVPVQPAESPTYYFELTQTEFETVSANPLFWGSDADRPRWKIVSNALAEQADTRRLVVFNPSTVIAAFQNNATISVGVQVRQAPPNESQIDTSISGDFDVKVIAKGPTVQNLWMRVSISAGVGTILIDREIVKEATIIDQGVFRVDTPLKVRILAPGRF
jgi:hypothetical protein